MSFVFGVIKLYKIYLLLVVANFYVHLSWLNQKTQKILNKWQKWFWCTNTKKMRKNTWKNSDFWSLQQSFTFFYLPLNCFTHIFSFSALIPLIFQSNFASSKFISKISYFTEHLAVKWVTCMVQINVHLILQS